MGAVLLAVAVLGAACGDDPDPLAAGDDPPVTVAEDGLVPFCDDVPPPGPVAEGDLTGTANPDEILLGVLQTYANAHPDTFGGLWIDRAAGSIVLAFTDDPAAHRAAIAELRPSPDDDPVVEPPPEITETTTVAESGTTVDVVQVAHTEAELRAVAEELTGLMDGDLGVFGVGEMEQLNRVSLHLRLADPATRAALAGIAPIDAVCVEGPESEPEPIDPATVDLLVVEDDPMVSCGGDEFRLSALDGPADFERSDDPAADAFRVQVEDLRPQFGDAVDGAWRELDRNDRRLLLGAGNPPGPLVTMAEEGGRWRITGSEGSSASEPCEMRRAVPVGLVEARWWLDPAFPEPGPDDTELHALVIAWGCSDGEPVGDRLIGPQVELTDDEVVVAFAALPLPPGPYTCPGNQPTPAVVTLDEPLGDRNVVDGMDLPPRDPVGMWEQW